MGCSSSSSAAAGSGKSKAGTAANGKNKPSIAEMAAAEKARREKLYEKQIKEKLYQQKDLLREKTMPIMMESIDDAESTSSKHLTEAQKRRREAKLKAEAEQRWMVGILLLYICFQL
jgi:hypothetical protein